MQVQEAAAKVVELFDEADLCKDNFSQQDDNGAYCAYCAAGAVGRVYFGKPTSGGLGGHLAVDPTTRALFIDKSHEPLIRALADIVRPGWENETKFIDCDCEDGEGEGHVVPVNFHAAVYEWNDAPERTKDEVVAAFRQIAEAA